jgi:hypothetical protein
LKKSKSVLINHGIIRILKYLRQEYYNKSF